MTQHDWLGPQDIKERIYRQMQSSKVSKQIYMLGRDVFEQALASENILLSRPEKERLLRQVLEKIFKDLSDDLAKNA